MPGNLIKDLTTFTLQTKYSMLWFTNKVPNVASGSNLERERERES